MVESLFSQVLQGLRVGMHLVQHLVNQQHHNRLHYLEQLRQPAVGDGSAAVRNQNHRLVCLKPEFENQSLSSVDQHPSCINGQETM